MYTAATSSYGVPSISSVSNGAGMPTASYVVRERGNGFGVVTNASACSLLSVLVLITVVVPRVDLRCGFSSVQVTLYGTNFGPASASGKNVISAYYYWTAQPSVLFPASSCSVTVADTTMVCMSSPGIGDVLQWVVTVGYLSSSPSR